MSVLFDEHGRPKLAIDQHFIIYALAFLVTAIIVIVLLITPHTKTYANCAQLKVAGHSNIPSSSPLYNASMDKDHDGHACE